VRRFVPLAEHPFELLFGLVAVGGGVALLAGVTTPTSLIATLPRPVVTGWAVTELIGGALILVGILLRHARPSLLLLGLRLERAGLWPLSAAAAVYSVAALGYAGLGGLYPVSILLAVAVACVARARAVAGIESTIRKHSGGRVGE